MPIDWVLFRELIFDDLGHKFTAQICASLLVDVWIGWPIMFFFATDPVQKGTPRLVGQAHVVS